MINRNWSFLLQSKQILRQTLRLKRKALSQVDQEKAAKKAADIFLKNPLFLQHQHIAAYIANDQELNPNFIVKGIWEHGKKCYLPIVSSLQANTLQFVEYTPDSIMKPNRYNILEPQNTKHIQTQQLDLVLVPLVAFDLKGNRLGMGGGYYDRTFAFKSAKVLKPKSYYDDQTENLPIKPVLIGLAYENQRVDELPSDNWDVPLDGVLTEKELLKFDKI